MLKRFFCLAMIFLFLTVNVMAEDGKKLDAEIESMFRAKITESDLMDIAQKFDVSVETVKEISDNSVLIVRYYGVFFNEADKPLEEQLNNIKSAEYDYRIFMVIGEEIGILNGKKEIDGKETIEIYVEETLPTYIEDILELDENILYENEEYKIEDVEIFDARTSHLGTLVYLVCNKGTLVKYYADSKSEAVWYSESAFRDFAKEYDAYCEKSAYNEKGEPVNGGIASFQEFVDNYEIYSQYKNGEGQQNKPIQYEKWIIPLLLGAIIFLGTAVGVIVVKRKQKNIK